jgi:hypothetical protein
MAAQRKRTTRNKAAKKKAAKKKAAKKKAAKKATSATKAAPSGQGGGESGLRRAAVSWASRRFRSG